MKGGNVVSEEGGKENSAAAHVRNLSHLSPSFLPTSSSGKLNEGLGAKTLPQKIFIGGLIISGFATFPLCFDLNTVS